MAINKGGQVKRFYVLIIFMFIFITQNWADSIEICVETRELYPFFFVENDTPKGILLDMVRDGFLPLGIEPVFKPLPMRRGIKMVEKGKIDALIAPRVKNENFLLPDDAFKTNVSKHRILQIDSVVVTNKSDYEFFGDINTLPTPIRITIGDPIESLFNEHKLPVDDAASGDQNIKKLMRNKKGCVVTTSLKAMTWLENPKFTNHIDVSTEPVISRSYFLIFSKKTPLDKNKIKQVWDEIAKNRDDYIYPIKLFTSY